MATIRVHRKTRETDVLVELDPRAEGRTEIATGIGFFDHMLELLAFHATWDLKVHGQGDRHVDAHHTVEDVGLALGQALNQAWTPVPQVRRYGAAFVPMDEALARGVVDLSGRPGLVFQATFRAGRLGTFETECVREFFQALVNQGAFTLHLAVLYGRNTHHQIEALFKAAGVALRQALERDPARKGPASSKGVLA